MGRVIRIHQGAPYFGQYFEPEENLRLLIEIFRTPGCAAPRQYVKMG